MNRINESQAVEVTVTPTKVAFKARGLLAVKLGFIGSFSLAHLLYDFWVLKIDAILSLLTYLLSVTVFVAVFTYCWDKTFFRTKKK